MRNYLDQIRPDHRVSTVMSPLGTYSKKYHPHPEPDYIYMYTGSVVNNPGSRLSRYSNRNFSWQIRGTRLWLPHHLHAITWSYFLTNVHPHPRLPHKRQGFLNRASHVRIMPGPLDSWKPSNKACCEFRRLILVTWLLSMLRQFLTHLRHV